MEDQPRHQPAMATATQELRDLFSTRGPSTAQVLRVVLLVLLVLLSGVLLLLAGLTLAGTLVGLAVTTPLFVLFSPLLIPAALTIGLAVAGFLTSVAFGVTALFFFTWMVNYLRRTRERPPASDGQQEDAGAPTSSTSPQPGDSGPSAPVDIEKEKSEMLVNQQQQGKTTLRKADDTQAFTSYATSTGSKNYDVFLSFSGLDTRKSFVDHLYHRLIDAGISVFRDDDELCEGENIGANLLQAIENSKISIPVLSQNYASSKWCLQELVQMVERMKSGHVILPIFYHVEPADVRHQKGNFGGTFSDLSGKYVEEDVTKWKQALQEVASLKGWDSKTTANGREGELVKLVVTEVCNELKKTFPLRVAVTEEPVGIDSAVEKVLRLLDNNPNATRIIGIYGMGGIGKTTLAKAVYNKLVDQFRHHSFIADIRESLQRNGILSLQNQLICDLLKAKDQVSTKDEAIHTIKSRCGGKKVLILLDDVGHKDQLEHLVGEHNWFERGSRIIITTRINSILDANDQVNCSYKHEKMDEDHSLILFSRHAFRRDSPPLDFATLSHDIISTTGGLPLALKVIGSSLRGRNPQFWRGQLKRLKDVPHGDVQKTLQISYEALNYQEQQIFLDIACFFIGTDVRIASYMWDDCGFYPSVGIEILRFMSLIEIGDNNELKMHDQLRDLCREIVRQEDYKAPMNRSRLWVHEEALAVLQKNKGIEKLHVRALRLDQTDLDCEFTTEQFEALPNLRFLQVRDSESLRLRLGLRHWKYGPRSVATVFAKLVGDSKSLLPELRWLQWEHCPASVATVFHLEKLVVLDLSLSSISELCEGWSHIKVAKELKVINLAGCDNLKVTPDLSAFQNLEILVLAGCSNLEQIHSSIGEVKGLVYLDFSQCGKLRVLPGELGKLEELKELKINGTAIEEIPESLGDLKNMKILDIVGSKVSNLPSTLGKLGNLEELHASGCSSLGGEFPIDGLSSLEFLELRSTGISGFPDTFDKFSHLERLDLRYCKKLQSLPQSISKLPSLQHLLLAFCDQLQSLPELPSCLTVLEVTCQSRTLPQLSHLVHLKELKFWNCKFLESIPGLPSGILKLSVFGCAKLKELPSLSSSEFLSQLDIEFCKELTEIKGLEALKALVDLTVLGSKKLSKLDGLEHAESLRWLSISSSSVNDDLHQVRGLDRLKNLEALYISGCEYLIRPDLSQLTHLKQLHAGGCCNLVEIKGLERLKNLEKLDIGGTSIETLPDLSCLDNLRWLRITGCEKLGDVQVLEKVHVQKKC